MRRARRILRDYGPSIIKFVIATRVLTPVVRWLGLYVLTDHFYHPIPTRSALLNSANVERALYSINWRPESQLNLAKNLLATYKHEFNDRNIIGSCGYLGTESSIGSGDAELLYAMIRHRKPQRVIEIGSGGSTRIIAAALQINSKETNEIPEFITIDPSPIPFLASFDVRVKEFVKLSVIKTRVQKMDLDLFRSLQRKDILFVDSSHVFKQDSDVEFEFLAVYPCLNEGVAVHIHDIFFPFDYPLEWNTRDYRFWNEQYFLEVFLQFNTRFEVILSLSYIASKYNHLLLEMINDYHIERRPGSFWMQVLPQK